VRRVLIKYDEDIGPGRAVWYVQKVMDHGLVSEAAGIPHYCWATKFADGISVVVQRKRQLGAADSFIVYREEK
jgi:hypothetical protein